MQDDLIIGGDDQRSAAHNYVRILHKLYLANLKVEPEKTTIFTESCDVVGWIWKKGGFPEVLPHRKSLLLKAKREQITKVKYLQSFIGLYKTLHMATPAISHVLAPLEDAVAGKDSIFLHWLDTLPHTKSQGSQKSNKNHSLYIYRIQMTNLWSKLMRLKTHRK